MFDKKVVSVVASVVAGINLLLYISMRSVLGYIGYYTFTALPYILGVILAAVLVLSLMDTLHKHSKKALVALFIADIVFFISVLTYFIVMISNYKVFLLEAGKIFLLYTAIAILVFLIFYFHKTKFYTKTVATVICIVLVLGIIIGFTDIGNLQINYFTNGAAVYAVETDYQIVWTTYVKGMGWVEIDGVKYYDETAGSVKTNETVHKVTIPQSVLDSAKSYTICSKAMINEEAYSALLGRTITKAYTFRPIDETDGIQYYTVSDTHGNNAKGIAAGSYYGASTDFVIIAGDAVSYIDSVYDLECILSLANSMTNGTIPVIYARGNHEVKSEQAENLYKYVGCDENQNFYFTFRLGSIWGIVLDQGENHEDSWYENYGTADFDSYRQAQLDMLDNIIANKATTYEASGITHRIAISHINTSFVSNGNFFMYEYMVDLNTRLNQLGLDVMLSGHLHQVLTNEAGVTAGTELYLQPEYTGNDTISSTPEYYATGAMYPTIICARRSDAQALTSKEKLLGKTYIATALEFSIDGDGDNMLTVKFTTNKKRIISTINPFTGVSYGNTIYLY